jgi:ribosome-binding protein aMBF1 (putative translation factor)
MTISRRIHRSRQEEWVERKKAEGFVQIATWVPGHRKEEFLALARGAADGSDAISQSIVALTAFNRRRRLPEIDAVIALLGSGDCVTSDNASLPDPRQLDIEGAIERTRQSVSSDITQAEPTETTTPAAPDSGAMPTTSSQTEPTTSTSPAPTQADAPALPKPKTPEAVALGKRIKAAREAHKGLSIMKLSKLVGTSHSLPGHWETGRNVPSPENFRKLVEIIGKI